MPDSLGLEAKHARVVVSGCCDLDAKLPKDAHLEGQADLVSRLIAPITHIVTLIIPMINLLTKSP